MTPRTKHPALLAGSLAQAAHTAGTLSYGIGITSPLYHTCPLFPKIWVCPAPWQQLFYCRCTSASHEEWEASFALDQGLVTSQGHTLHGPHKSAMGRWVLGP